MTEPILELEFEKNERYEKMIAEMNICIQEKDKALSELAAQVAELQRQLNEAKNHSNI